jgi:hypothetical protein
MAGNFLWRRLIAEMFVFLFAAAALRTLATAKDKPVPVDPNDATVRLFQLLDESHGGKLSDFYILADLYKDKNSSNPGQELQHVLSVDYDKNRGFGRLNIHIRSLDKLGPEQLKTYTAKQIFDFGDYDLEKFVKSVPGPLGQVGDVYLLAGADHPLQDTPITDEVRKEYDLFVTQFIIPALQKK